MPLHRYNEGQNRSIAAAPPLLHARNLSRNMSITPRSARRLQRPRRLLLSALIVLGAGLSWAIAADQAVRAPKAAEHNAA